MSPRLAVLCVLVATLPFAATGAEGDNRSVIIDDFASGKLEGWQFSSSPDYYKGGFGASGLAVVRDAERGANVLKAHIAFKDPRASEVAFITKSLSLSAPLYKFAKVTFWYKVTTGKLARDNGLVCRLRTSDMAFTDYPFGRGGEMAPGQWQRVEIDVARPKRLVNIYATYFKPSPLREMTFRLDDEDAENVEFDLYLADIRIELKEPQVAAYEPVIRPREPHAGLNALIVTQSAAGYYGIEAAAKSLPEAREVKRLLFRGLHFPIFGFPSQIADLLRYDLVALIDVDPYVLTIDQVKMLSDFVASGGGLLFASGPSTFGAATDFKTPLRDLLPVNFVEGIDVLTVDAIPQILEDHPVVRGLPPLGKVARLCDLSARPQAKLLLSLPPKGPHNWGWYSGGNPKAANLTRSPDARTGKASACLELKEFYTDPKTGQPAWISVALIQGNSNGYGGPSAYPAKPSTTYRFSFWAKGNVPKFRVECLAWKSLEARPGDREHIQTTLGDLVPSAEWKKYEGAFTTPPDIKRFVLSFIIRENPKTVKLGERLLVDDVELTEASAPTQNLLVNGGAEDEQRTPVLVVGEFHGGRVAVLNAIPAMEETTEGSFFTSDGYDDLLRELLTWLAKREQGVWVKQFVPPSTAVRRGEAVETFVGIGRSQPVGVRLSYVLSRNGQICDRQRRVAGAEDDKVILFRSEIGRDYHADGPYQVTVTAADPLGDIIAARTASFRVLAPIGLSIEFLYGKSAFAPGSSMHFVVRATPAPPKGMTIVARIREAVGGTVHEFSARPAQQLMEYDYSVPELEKGEYKIIASLVDGASSAVQSEATGDFSIVDRLDMENFYPIMSIIGVNGRGQMLDESGIRERIDDLLAHGFNTVAYGGGKIFAATPLSNSRRLLNYAERYAQSHGMGVIYEYTRFTDLESDKPPQVCPFAPEYARKFEERFRTDVEVCKTVPRLISFKVLDEPTASEATLDFCQHCQATFKQKYGLPLRKLKDIPSDAIWDRLCHNQFISDYVSAGYRTGLELKNRLGGRYGLLLTYMAAIAGYANVDRAQEDGFEWSRWADLIDFDVYPYFYPDSDKIRMVKAHWVFAYLRAVAKHLNKPMGFYVELDDRNYPLQINPAKASSECAYTAIGQGCDYLNSFINTAFGTGSGARPDRWEDCGREMQKIASVGPLLKKMKKAPSTVAVYFPHTQWYVQGKSYAPVYAYQLVLRAFGECDILHEKVLREKGPGSTKVILLFGVDLLPDDCAEKLVAFVRNGGVLIADHVPTRNQTGAPCKWPSTLFGGESASVVNGLKVSSRNEGRGRTMLFSDDLDKVFKEAVETPIPVVRDTLLRRMRETFEQLGAHPHAQPDNPEFETDVRLGRDSALLVAINHAAEKGKTRVVLRDLGFIPTVAYDAVSGENVSIARHADSAFLDLELDARSARLISLYPEAVSGQDIQLAAPSFERGGRLKYEIRVKGSDGEAAVGHHVLEITVIDPRGIVHPRYGGLLATTNGVAARDVPLAINAARGEWTLSVYNRFTKERITRSFQVQ